MAVALQAHDDHPNERGPERRPVFDDLASGVGAWSRLGNRANEGRIELTLTRYATAAACPTASSLSTRVRKGPTGWRSSDGRIGYGPSEFLDQTIDGRPARVDE